MSKVSFISKGIVRLVAIFALGLGMVAPFALTASPASAASYTATSTDGTVFSASSLQNAQLEAASYNMTQAQTAAPGTVVTFAGITQSACLQAGNKYNGDYTTWNAKGAATSNCSYNPKTPTTIYCYKGAKLVKAVTSASPKCPAGLRAKK